ncbi:MAG: RNA methyltransferase [Myxococcales bacterium SG8_38_1]|jgi:TfoX/Sxy family transcriptional regulator of competence genes|nr:MAG: RNA methyltransferase [Myxococcales bacterium SG8_38_1]
MAYDEKLAERIREVLKRRRGVSEKEMFGGLAFLVNGHMACGVQGDDLMVRVGPEDYESALKKTGARPMDFTGRPLKGMVYVGPRGHRRAPSLKAWVERGLSYVRSLPPK